VPTYLAHRLTVALLPEAPAPDLVGATGESAHRLADQLILSPVTLSHCHASCAARSA